VDTLRAQNIETWPFYNQVLQFKVLRTILSICLCGLKHRQCWLWFLVNFVLVCWNENQNLAPFSSEIMLFILNFLECSFISMTCWNVKAIEFAMLWNVHVAIVGAGHCKFSAS